MHKKAIIRMTDRLKVYALNLTTYIQSSTHIEFKCNKGRFRTQLDHCARRLEIKDVSGYNETTVRMAIRNNE